MTTQMIIALAITVFMIIIIMTDKLPFGASPLLACLLLVVFGITDIKGAFAGFSNATIVMLACSLFGISNDIAMQVVGVGFIVGVIQDSCETAINSSTDVLYTAVAELSRRRKENA